MPIYASAGSGTSFTPTPAGTHQAVCVDVIDKGLQPNKFKPGTTQQKIDIAWQIGETRDDGKPYMVFKRYTLSINEKANLRHDLESWRGRAFTREEEMRFDVESVIGANCLVSIQHNTNGDKTYANVMSVMPLLKGMARLTPSADYVRVCNRTEQPEAHDETPPERETPAPITDDDIPF